MLISPGDRFGPYEILDAIGAGGMGEVYKARDTRLDRVVAIKTSKDQFTERFEREARAVAALNHPNICTLHDVGPNYLVMEYIDGPTLAGRIAAGPLPLQEAIVIARQIADALEAAHEKGIVHRDLKPANIKLTADGKVKVLDFGLAKAFDGETNSADPRNSPTLTLSATRAGMILGTAGYMSPEQARGVAADKRADIWSFGVVLLEMLTGRAVFAGETVSDTLASVLKTDPDWAALPPETPEPIRRLLRRCLQRDRKLRLRDIGDARLELDEPVPPALPAAPVVRSSRLPWTIAAALLLALAAVPFALWRRQPAADIYQVSLVPPEKAAFTPLGPQTGGFAVSPDGRTLAFVATQDGQSQLWIRPLDSQAARPLPGTASAYYPFWSPDSRFIGFFADGKVKRIEVSGGPPQVICDAGIGRGGTWSPDGVIVFTGTERILRRVAASGGEPVSITELNAATHENAHYWPSFLPDGRHFLYLARHDNRNESVVCAASLDAPKQCIEVVKANSNVQFAPAAPGAPSRGSLLFLRGNGLLAQSFDPGRLKLAGEAVPIAEHVGFLANITVGNFSSSANGLLIYARESFDTSRLVWMDRDGRESPLPLEPGAYQGVRLSPDGTRAAVARIDQASNEDIWLLDLAHNVMTRFTFEPNTDFFPVWSPDGRQIAFSSTRKGAPRMYLKPASGAADEELISPPGAGPLQLPSDWSRDGKYLLFLEINRGTAGDLGLQSMSGEHKPPDHVQQPLLRTPFTEAQGQFSPDGAWVAYNSDESGRSEIYVRSFAPTGGKFQVSANGGVQPRWRADGKELFFLTLDGKLMAASVKTSAGSFEREMPRMLFAANWMTGNAENDFIYDVNRDGRRFLFLRRSESDAVEPLTLRINWQAALRK